MNFDKNEVLAGVQTPLTYIYNASLTRNKALPISTESKNKWHEAVSY
jgi:hypothetical protein